VASGQPARGSAAENYSRPLVIVTCLFFLWGMLTSMNDILVPHFRSIFDLSFARVMLVQFSFFSAYFFFSMPWSKVLNAIGYQRTMATGLLTMAAGAFLFVPAAWSVSYPLFLTALIILAAGITGLQVAANPYVVALGRHETASSRLDLTQAFNSLGTTIGPKMGDLLILSAAPGAVAQLNQLDPQALHLYRMQQAGAVKMPYAVIGATLLLSAIVFSTLKLPAITTPDSRPGESTNDSIWKHSNLIFGVIAIFAYVGAEVSIGSFLVNYLGLPEITGFSTRTAAGYVSFYWGGAMIGRFLGAGVLRRVSARHLLAVCAICAAALVTTSMTVTGHPAMWSMIVVGFFNSIMFPTIFALAVAELGPLTGNGSGIMNMAIVGGAILPLMQGIIADHVGLHHAFVLPVVCYLYILYYGLSGAKPNKINWQRAA
jgi:FHS family L-fucose permease-like MFS transporter